MGYLVRIITWAFVIGIVYRLIVRVVLPFFGFTSATRQHINQIRSQMEEMQRKMNGQGQPQPQQQAQSRPKVKKEGDYIDYEEIK